MKLNYKGKVNGGGDGIKFTVDGVGGQTTSGTPGRSSKAW